MKRDLLTILFLILILIGILIIPRHGRAEEPSDGLRQCFAHFVMIKSLDSEYQNLHQQAEELGRTYRDLDTQLRAINGSIARAKRTKNQEDLEAAEAHREFHELRMNALRLEGEMVVAAMNEVQISSLQTLIMFAEGGCGVYDKGTFHEMFEQSCTTSDFRKKITACEAN